MPFSAGSSLMSIKANTIIMNSMTAKYVKNEGTLDAIVSSKYLN